MNRLTTLLALSFIFLLVCGEIPAANRPNIVLMMADDMGWGDPQFNNPDSPIQTPHLDAMAAAGAVWTRFYSAGPVCSPTRGACLTGRHPYRYGVYFANTGHLEQEEIALPELLQEQGYRTGHFGKWHLGTLTTTVQDANRGGPKGAPHFATPQMNGYDTCFVTESKVPTFDPMLKPHDANGKGWDAIVDKSTALTYGTRYWDEQGESVTDNLLGDDSRIIMDRAVPFIKDAVAEEAPFFCVVWFHAPHLPVVAGAKHVAPYLQHDVYERNYYGCVSALDEQVGRLRQTLQELNVAENTMVWYCSDNGPEGQAGNAPGSAGPFRGRKRSLYEGGVRVPGILEWPARVTPGSVIDTPAVTSDYLPTILDLLDIEYPDSRPLDGISLLPVIEGETARRDSPIGFQSRDQQSWVTDQHKLYTSDAGKTWELYDLQSDPAETTNLAAEHSRLVKQLRAELQTWLDSCKASDAGEDYR